MIKNSAKKLSLAMLAFVLVTALAFGAICLFPTSAKADATKAVEDIIDLSQGPNAGIGQPNADAAANLIKFHFKDVNLPDGGRMEEAKVSEGVTIGDLVLVDNGTAEKSLNQWTESSGNRAFRLAVYGSGMYLQCENEGAAVKKVDIKYVTFKAGFMLFHGTDGDVVNDWVFARKATTKVEGTEFATDLKLYVNFANNSYDYATETLTVKSAPTKTEYEIGETFDPSGMVLEAVTATSGTKEITVTSGMCSAVDLSEAGEKTVTVSYGGKTVTQSITVKVPQKTLTSIAYKSGSVSVEQNGSVGEMTINDLKITVSYEGGETEEVAVTADMISVDPANLGKVKGKVTYAVGTQKQTCEIDVTVTERTAAYTAENIYPVPLDGYYAGEDGGDRELVDSGINVWFTTNAGYGGEHAYTGLGEKWYSDDENIHKIVKAHVLINGKTFDEFNNGGDDLTRFLVGWYGNGKYCLRIHVKNGFDVGTVQTITLLKGFQLYNTSLQPLGVPTPCDYTMEVADKTGSDKKMLVRKTESVEVETAPTKTAYYTDEQFETNGMTIKAVYTDGGYAIIPVKDRMVSYDFTTVSETSPVTVTYNGKTVTTNVAVSVRPVTLESIAVKDGAKLFLKQYSLVKTLTPDAKLVLTYSDESTGEAELKLDMISGYTNETVGDGTATVTYQDKTCDIVYTVSEYDETSTINGIKYGLEQTPSGLDGISVEFDRTDDKDLKALWDIDKATSAVIGKTNGDFVTINGEKLSVLTQKREGETQPRVARMWVYGRRIGFHIDNADFMAQVKNGAEICILPGFAWSVNGSDAWGTSDKCGEYSIIENAVVTKPMYFCFKDGKSAKVVESIALKGTPKANYYKDDVIDLTGLTLEVSCKGLEKETIPVTKEMCSYDFSTAGEKTVTVTYEGKTATFNVTVSEVRLTDIRIETEPTKKEYDFGIENELDTTGLAVYAVYSDGTEELVEISSLVFEGFDSRAFGKQTITVKYGEFSKTFEIEVIDKSKNKYLSIEYGTGAWSFETEYHNSLVISFMMNGVYEDYGSFWGTDKYEAVAEYMLINDKKVSDLIKEGKVTRLATWAQQLVIHLDTCDLVPATWVDKRKNPDDENDKGIHYIEGKSEVVKTVTFLPGFQWYTTKPASSVGWGKNDFNSAVPVTGAVLKEKVTITNNDGYGWTRELKKDENGNVAADALTIVTYPKKTVYQVGDPLKVNDMEILAKYADGGEVILNPANSEIEGYKRNEVGEQTLTYTYQGVKLTFTVSVTEKTEDSGNSGTSTSGGGCSGSVGLGGMAVLGLFAALVCLKKKRENV